MYYHLYILYTISKNHSDINIPQYIYIHTILIYIYKYYNIYIYLYLHILECTYIYTIAYIFPIVSIL